MILITKGKESTHQTYYDNDINISDLKNELFGILEDHPNFANDTLKLFNNFFEDIKNDYYTHNWTFNNYVLRMDYKAINKFNVFSSSIDNYLQKNNDCKTIREYIPVEYIQLFKVIMFELGEAIDPYLLSHKEYEDLQKVIYSFRDIKEFRNDLKRCIMDSNVKL